MGGTETTKPDDLNRFIDICIENRYCLKLLRFWGAHPRTRFDRRAVMRAFDKSDHKAEFEEALLQLVDKGIVEASVENDTYLYSLTEDESIRPRVLALVRPEWPIGN